MSNATLYKYPRFFWYALLFIAVMGISVHLGYYMAAQDYKQLCQCQCDTSGPKPWSKRLFWDGK